MTRYPSERLSVVQMGLYSLLIPVLYLLVAGKTLCPINNQHPFSHCYV